MGAGRQEEEEEEGGEGEGEDGTQGLHVAMFCVHFLSSNGLTAVLCLYVWKYVVGED